jgi:viroplasmin and RNaseH domain-containing protein
MARKINLLVIPLIFAILIIIGLVIALISINSDIEVLRADLKIKTQDAETYFVDLNKSQRAFKQMQDILCGSTFELEAYWRNFIDPQNNEELKQYLKSVGAESKTRNVESRNLKDVLAPLFGERMDLLARAEKLEIWLRQERLDKKRAIHNVEQIETEKNAEIEKLNAKNVQQAQDMEALRADMTQQINAKNDEISTLKQIIDQMRKDHDLAIARYDSRVAELKGRIKELTKKDPKMYLEICEPDGQINYADDSLGKAWINLGRVHNIRKGMNFQVLQFLKGGIRRQKGRVEVIKVDDTTSEVAIKETVNPKDPLVRGDYIITPFYSKSETPIFVFCGNLTNPIYSKRELERKITELGGKVEQNVSIFTDYLIVGKDAEDLEDYQKALLYGVTMLRERDLFDYLGK